MVGELTHAPADHAMQRAKLWTLVLSVFDRYPTPVSLGEQVWRDARGELALRLQKVGLHLPKRAKDIPAPYARTYWDLMPIAKEARSADFPITHNYLMVTMCNIHDELTKRSDARLVSEQLHDRPVIASAFSS